MRALAGTPSDEVPAILATGRTDVTAIFVSMSARHPEGRDADYLAWHTLDHRPEQHRLASGFLDGDPVETAARLRPHLEKRWAGGRVAPLLAAPLYTVVPYEWERVLP